MPNSETFTALLRNELRQSLPQKAFLRLDRGSDLFVTNALIFDEAYAPPDGYEAAKDKTLLHISPSAGRIIRFESAFPRGVGPLSESARIYKNTAPGPEAVLLFSRGLKLWDMTDKAEWAAYDRAVRQLFAVTLRKKSAGGGLFALCLLDELTKL